MFLLFLVTYVPGAFITPWMFVKYGFRAPMLLAASLTATGSVVKILGAVAQVRQ